MKKLIIFLLLLSGCGPLNQSVVSSDGAYDRIEKSNYTVTGWNNSLFTHYRLTQYYKGGNLVREESRKIESIADHLSIY